MCTGPRRDSVHSEFGPCTRALCARCRASIRNSAFRPKAGFTLIEVLVALTILVVAFTIIWSAFSTTVRAWQKGGELLEDLRHGDFVMEQLVSAMRSAAFFQNAPDKYGFRMENGNRSYPADKISWVTSSTAFMPPDSPYQQGLHRIVFTIENNEDGDEAVAIRALSHLSEDDPFEEEPWFISSEVKGIDCRFYNFEDEAWEKDWEDTNALPSLVEVTLYMDPITEYGDPVKMQRLVEIPIAPAVTNAVKMDEGAGSDDGGGAAAGETSGSRTEEGGGVRIEGEGR